MKTTYKLKVAKSPPEPKFGALATPDAFMGPPLEIWYDPEYDCFSTRWGYGETEVEGLVHITTIRPVTETYRAQRVAEIIKLYRDHWEASCQ